VPNPPWIREPLDDEQDRALAALYLLLYARDLLDRAVQALTDAGGSPYDRLDRALRWLRGLRPTDVPVDLRDHALALEAARTRVAAMSEPDVETVAAEIRRLHAEVWRRTADS
jgi:hypothetical protein